LVVQSFQFSALHNFIHQKMLVQQLNNRQNNKAYGENNGVYGYHNDTRSYVTKKSKCVVLLAFYVIFVYFCVVYIYFCSFILLPCGEQERLYPKNSGGTFPHQPLHHIVHFIRSPKP